MAPQLTRDEVAHIAGLAKLDLSATELDTLARQLTDILAYAAIVQRAENPAPEPVDGRNPGTLRPDVPTPSLDRAVVLAEAPDADRASGLFRVPKVL